MTSTNTTNILNYLSRRESATLQPQASSSALDGSGSYYALMTNSSYMMISLDTNRQIDRLSFVATGTGVVTVEVKDGMNDHLLDVCVTFLILLIALNLHCLTFFFLSVLDHSVVKHLAITGTPCPTCRCCKRNYYK